MPAVTESITKNRQPTSTLQAMVTRALGPDAVLSEAHEITDGWFNVLYRLHLADGRTVVLKVAPPAGVDVLTYERDLMRTEILAMRLVGERSTVPVPEILFVDETKELCDADWFVMSFVVGENLATLRETLPADEVTSYDEQVGATNLALNEIRADRFGPLAGGGGPSWRPVFEGMLADVLADGERLGVDIGRSYDEVRAVIAANGDCLDEVTEPRFVEWDLWSGNVLVRDGAIVGIVDHERALYGDPLIEHGFAATGIDFGDPAPFLRGYGRGELSANEQARRRLYNLHLLLIMTIETVYRGHTDPSQYDWARRLLDDLMAQFES